MVKRLVVGRSLRRTLIRAAIVAVSLIIVFRFLLLPVRVTGGSMAPTYSENSINLVNRLAYLHHGPQRGDVVAVRFSPSGRSILLMKRVVGLPGEWIGFENGHVTVNGRPLQEDYVKYESNWNRKPVLCGPDQYFVVGDNRSMPEENHVFGRAKAELIAGKVIF